jgi:predicted GNAT family acetyltransferase
VNVVVTDNPDLNRYEARLGGELAGFAQYRLQGERMTIFHAEVDPQHEGQGVGSHLAGSALEDLRSRGLELDPRCPFIAAYVRRHADRYLDLVAEPLREHVMGQSRR